MNMKIAPVSDLRNYNVVVKNVSDGFPVILTKNGHEEFALVDIKEYQRMKATLKLMGELHKAEISEKNGAKSYTVEEARKALGL
ncbi:type II toxin-antitoxin system prevent-host-death family antitoxin [Pseudolactococcus yaeyamensis]